MRHIHPVGVSERFIASGAYKHYLDDTPTGTTETWQIHEQPDGAQMIRVDDDHRQRDGSSVLIEAWREPESNGGRIARVDLYAFGGPDAAIKELRANYIVDADQLEFGRTIDNGEREHLTLTLPTGYLVSPESLIFAGFEAAELAARGQAGPVVGFLPTLNAAEAFVPVVYSQSARFLRQETRRIAGRDYTARMFEQVNPADGAVTQLLLDDHDVLLAYHGPQGRHSAVLTEYARRPERKG